MSISGGARAQAPASAEAKAKARQFYDEGLTNYNLGHYTTALSSFESGYKLWHDSSFLFNIAQCERALNQYEDAERSYRAYLRESDNLSDTQREKIQRLIQEMEKAIQAERAKQPPTGTQPPAGVSQNQSKVDAQPQPTTRGDVFRSAPVEKHRPWYTSKVGWGLSSFGLAAGAAGAGLLGAAVSEHNQAAAANTQTLFNQHHSNVVHFQEAGWPLLGVGAAVVVAGVTMFVLHAKGRK